MSESRLVVEFEIDMNETKIKLDEETINKIYWMLEAECYDQIDFEIDNTKTSATGKRIIRFYGVNI